MEDYLLAAELLDRADTEGFIPVFDKVGRGIKLKIHISKELWNTDISELLISSRSFHGLSNAKLHTVGCVVEKIMSGEGLEGIRNLGEKSIVEIKTAVLDLSYGKLTEKEKAAFWLQIVKANPTQSGDTEHGN